MRVDTPNHRAGAPHCSAEPQGPPASKLPSLGTLIQSNAAAPGGDVSILQGKLELLSYLSQKHSSVRATCNICSPQAMVEQKTLM